MCEWPEEVTATAEVRCADGAYLVSAKRPHSQSAALDLEADARALHVEADAEIVRGADHLDPGESIGFGVGCWVGEFGYVFEVWADGTFAIARYEGRRRETVPLAFAGGSSERVTRGRVGADCVSEQGTTSLVLSLDGEAVLAARDDRSLGAFDEVGFALVAPAAGVEVRFDNIEARELSVDEIAAVDRHPVSEPTTTSLPFADDFSNRATGWATGENEQVSLEYEQGGYRVRAKVSEPQWSLFDLGSRVAGVSLAATARMDAGPPSTLLGVVCYSGKGDGYVLALTAGGGYVIVREHPRRFRILKAANKPDLVRTDEPVRLDASCVLADGVARLALGANGSQLARVEDDRDPPQAFDTTGIFAGSDQPGANILFDDFSAREIP